jgi:hypothetical protein
LFSIYQNKPKKGYEESIAGRKKETKTEDKIAKAEELTSKGSDSSKSLELSSSKSI